MIRSKSTLAVAMLTAALPWTGCSDGSTPEEIAELSAASSGNILSTSATNTDTAVTYTMSYAAAGTFYRVYIDTDQNASTGFAVGGAGAEYLLENSNLYKYTGSGSDWSWSKVKSEAFSASGGTARWTVARADIGETSACSEKSTLVFDIDDFDAPKLNETYSPASGCSGSSSSSSSTGSGGAGGAGGSSGTGGPNGAVGNFVTSNDDQNVHYQYTYTGSPSYWRVYIDTDQNASTGFAAGSGVGADYLVEGNTLYKSTGTAWGWTQVAGVSFSTANQTASWTVPRSLIGETKACGEQSTLLFQTEDSAIHSSTAYSEVFTNAASCGGGSGGGSSSSSSGSSSSSSTGSGGSTGSGNVKYVFVIALENESSSSIYGNSSAPYIQSLMSQYAYATAFKDPLPDALPSEPHYVWMEAGTNSFSDTTFTTDDDPSSSNSTASTAHLSTQLTAAGVSWMSYQEGLNGSTGACPIVSSGFYAAKHDPFVFFRDVAGNPPSKTNSTCAAHHKAYSAFGSDLAAGAVAKYNFISPNVCNDMHGDPSCPSGDPVAIGDQWLQNNLPPIITFINAHSGALFLVWDEPEGGTLIPFLAIGPGVKAGHVSSVTYNHGSLVKTTERIFGVPTLSTVSGVNDFSDLFVSGALP